MAESTTQKNSPRRGPGGPGGPGGFMAVTEKPKDFKGTITKLLKYLGKYKIATGFVIIFAIASTIFNIVGPKILSGAITKLFEGLVSKFSGTGGIDFGAITQILMFMLALYAFAAIMGFIQGWIMSGISQKISFKMREDISTKIGRMPMKYFESKTVGEVLSRVTNDVDTLGTSLNQSITQLITSVITIIGVIVMMLSINWQMTLISLAIVPISLALIGVVVKNSQKHFKAQQEQLGVINGQVEETISGQSVVKLFNYEDEALREFDGTNGKLYKSAWMSQFLSGLMQPLMNFVGNLGYVGVAIAGGVFAFSNLISVGDIQAFIQYVRNLTQPIAQFAQITNMLQSMAAAAERVFEFLGEEEEEQTVSDGVVLKNPQGAVSFSHVKFGYDPEKIIINDFNCDVKPGQTIAIVGPTGAGKTTIVKLLMRFYDIISGEIKVDGHDLRRFNRSDLRENFGMVLQDSWLTSGTIMENIRYGKLDATDEEVYAAAKAAHVDHFIRTLQDGYNTELSEDAGNISQGQKQLLTIARAILANNPILILDEATSSVDTRTEVLIQKAMNALMQGRTSFVIAHRLSTIKDADVILVMRDGDIVEQGSHAALIEKSGFYADLWSSQFEHAV
ncbi:ABC transporter [Clostridia bacterium]|nr:ABC transporter [Clostridia bacterium]